MDDLIVALGLFLFIEGILYALFPSKMKNMLEKLKMISDKQLRSGGIIFALIGFKCSSILVSSSISMKSLKNDTHLSINNLLSIPDESATTSG